MKTRALILCSSTHHTCADKHLQTHALTDTLVIIDYRNIKFSTILKFDLYNIFI